MLSFEARYYYETGNYKKAYELAKKAYILNPYNKMAFTIKTQSQIALSWQNFIEDFNKFFDKIQKIANKEKITKKDKLRIKIMLEILISEYKTLKLSLLIPKKLKKEAKEKYQKARELYERLFKK